MRPPEEPAPGAGAPSAAGSPARALREEGRRGDPYDLWVNVAWEGLGDGLAAGITRAGRKADFGLSTVRSPLTFLRRYAALGRQLGFGCVALARQVHGAGVVRVGACDGSGRTGPGGSREPRFLSPGEADGLWTEERGVLLTATAADCVPVYLTAVGRPGLAGLVHAGWRGVAAGVLEAAVTELRERAPVAPGDLRLHLGPAICGACYEVGGEVLRALGRRAPPEKGRVDLRRELLGRARSLGIRPERTTISPWCTRCSADRFHSHRGSGHRAGRMAAFLGWRTVEG